LLQNYNFIDRTHAAAIHLLISIAIAAMAAALVFGVWFPGIYRQVAGGRELFWLVTSVDLVLGPLLTFAVFNLRKGWSHLRRDLAVIAAIQLAALIYGLVTVHAARPVAMVFETDRFRVITAADVEMAELSLAPPAYRQLPLTGPWQLGARPARQGAEHNDALFKGVAGVDRGQRPLFWQPYADSTAEALARARPLALLLARYPQQAADITAALQAQRVDTNQAKFLPLTGRGGDWVVVLDATGQLVHYAPVDGFF
jgi:hypothetical protein